MSKKRVLTGVTTTGIPHLGNYVGAIRPAIAAAADPAAESFLFLADYHGIIKCHDPELIHASTQAVAATWLACGLDPERTTFYRQSDIPEVPELNWILTCITAKGLMNRAHAYKAAVQANLDAGQTDQEFDVFVDFHFGQGEEFLETVVEAAGNVARHFDMLDLVASDGNFVGVEHEDVGSHQNRITEQTHFHTEIRIFLIVFCICLYSGFVGMGAVHQTLGGDAGQNPVQFHHFGNVALAVEGGALGVESAGKPSGGNGLGGLVNHLRLVAFNDAVVVGEEKEGFGIGILRRADGRADGADVVAQMRDAGGGYAGEDAFLAHCVILLAVPRGVPFFRRPPYIFWPSENRFRRTAVR